MRMPKCFFYASAAIVLAGCPGGDDSGTDTQAMTTTGPGSTSDPGSTTDPETTVDPDTSTTTDATSSTTDAVGGNFEMTLMGYPHNDQTASLVVLDDAGTEVVSVSATIADMQAILADTSGPLMDGGSYDVFWYVDVNGNMACDAPPADHSWEMLDQVADATGLTLSHMHDANWTDVCGSF